MHHSAKLWQRQKSCTKSVNVFLLLTAGLWLIHSLATFLVPSMYTLHTGNQSGVGRMDVSLEVKSHLCQKGECPLVEDKVTMVNTSRQLKPEEKELVNHYLETVLQKSEPISICNTSYKRTVVCDMDGDIRIQGKSTIHVITGATIPSQEVKVKPYARKEDTTALHNVRQLTITQLNSSPLRCHVNHTVPAIVFSTGGYLGNVFHDFVDVLVPLFTTARPFSREVRLLVTNYKPWWIVKYKPILEGLTRFEILDLDSDSQVHCFPRVTVGLKRHDTREFSVDPSPHPGGLTLRDLAGFLRTAFSLGRPTVSAGPAIKPRLLILSRRKTRRFMNVRAIAKEARKVGFEVVESEGSESEEFVRLVNSCDAMLGVHGAGLTNEVFLPEGAVVMQVVPLGKLRWWSFGCFGEPAEEMGLRYLQYEIAEKESTLLEVYPRNHSALKDTQEYTRKEGWKGFEEVFLHHQNVRLDVKRFRGVLKQALDLLRN